MLHPDIQSKPLWKQSIVAISFLVSSPLFALKLSCETVKHSEQQMGTIRLFNRGHYLSLQRFYFGILNLNCRPLNLTSLRWLESLISQPRGSSSSTRWVTSARWTGRSKRNESNWISVTLVVVWNAVVIARWADPVDVRGHRSELGDLSEAIGRQNWNWAEL